MTTRRTLDTEPTATVLLFFSLYERWRRQYPVLVVNVFGYRLGLAGWAEPVGDNKWNIRRALGAAREVGRICNQVPRDRRYIHLSSVPDHHYPYLLSNVGDGPLRESGEGVGERGGWVGQPTVVFILWDTHGSRPPSPPPRPHHHHPVFYPVFIHILAYFRRPRDFLRCCWLLLLRARAYVCVCRRFSVDGRGGRACRGGPGWRGGAGGGGGGRGEGERLWVGLSLYMC